MATLSSSTQRNRSRGEMHRRRMLASQAVKNASNVQRSDDGSTTTTITHDPTTQMRAIQTKKRADKRKPSARQRSRFHFFKNMFNLLVGRPPEHLARRIQRFDSPRSAQRSHPIIVNDATSEGNTVTFDKKFTRAHGKKLLSPKAAFSMASEYRNRMGANAKRSVWAFHETKREDGGIKRTKKSVDAFTAKDVEDVAMVVVACKDNHIELTNADQLSDLIKYGNNRKVFQRASDRYYAYMGRAADRNIEGVLMDNMRNTSQTRPIPAFIVN